MWRAQWIYILSGLWALLFVTSFIVFGLTEPTDSGFTRGLNRAEGWFKWQAVALVAAIAAVAYTRNLGPSLTVTEKRIGYLPIAISGVMAALLILVVIGVILFPG